MKKTLIMTLSILLMGMTSLTTFGQNTNNKERINRAQLAVVQARNIAKEIGLNEKTTEKYVKTFCDYQKEVWNLGPRITERATSSQAKTNKMEDRFERSQKILALRKKYYKKYLEFMTPDQIENAYLAERKQMDFLVRHKMAKDHQGTNAKKNKNK